MLKTVFAAVIVASSFSLAPIEAQAQPRGDGYPRHEMMRRHHDDWRMRHRMHEMRRWRHHQEMRRMRRMDGM